MQTLTEIVAAVVVQSSAAAFSHFGVTLDAPHQPEKPAPVERIVARTAVPTPAVRIVERAQGAVDCPTQRAQLVKT